MADRQSGDTSFMRPLKGLQLAVPGVELGKASGCQLAGLAGLAAGLGAGDAEANTDIATTADAIRLNFI